MEELDQIVKKMIAAGEPRRVIEGVVLEWRRRQEFTKEEDDEFLKALNSGKSYKDPIKVEESVDLGKEDVVVEEDVVTATEEVSTSGVGPLVQSKQEKKEDKFSFKNQIKKQNKYLPEVSMPSEEDLSNINLDDDFDEISKRINNLDDARASSLFGAFNTTTPENYLKQQMLGDAFPEQERLFKLSKDTNIDSLDQNIAKLIGRKEELQDLLSFTEEEGVATLDDPDELKKELNSTNLNILKNALVLSNNVFETNPKKATEMFALSLPLFQDMEESQGKYEVTQLYDFAEKNLNKIIEKEIKPINLADYVKKNQSGVLRPDLNAIDEFSSKLTKKLLPKSIDKEGSIFSGTGIDLVFGEKKDQAFFQINNLIYEKLNNKAESYRSSEFVQKDTKNNPEVKALSKKIGEESFDAFKKNDAAYFSYLNEAKKIDFEITNEYESKNDNLYSNYKNLLKLERQKIEQQLSNRSISNEKANQRLTKINSILFEKYISSNELLINSINVKKDSLQKNIADEMNAKYLEFNLTYNPDPKDIAKLNAIYSDSYKKFFEQENKKLKADEKNPILPEYMNGFLVEPILNFGKEFFGTTGRVISGYGLASNDKNLIILGDKMNQTFNVAPDKIKDWSELLDLSKSSKAAGRLAGSALPSIISGGIVAMETKGMATLPRFAAIAIAGWGTETLDMTMSIKKDVLARTGSFEKSNKAGEAMLDAQLENFYLYSFEAIPFVNSALKFIPNKYLRIGAAGVSEAFTETLQEVPQSAQEQTIIEKAIKGEEITSKGWREKVTPEFVKEIALEVIPGAGLMGSVTRAITEFNSSAQKENVVNDLTNQLRLSSVANKDNLFSQHISSSMSNHGEGFTKAWISSFGFSGKISPKKFNSLIREVESYKSIEENWSKYPSLSNTQKALFSKLTQDVNNAKEKSEKLKGQAGLYEAAKKEQSNAEANLSLFIENPSLYNQPYVEIKIGNQETKIINRDDLINLTIEQPELFIKDNNIEVVINNDESLVNYFNEKFDEINKAPTEEVSEVPAEVVKLRAEEQAEMLEQIPGAENALTDGKVDKEKLTTEEGKTKFQEIYDKYNDKISPLLKTTPVEEVSEKLETAPAEEAPYDIEEYNKAMEEGFVDNDLIEELKDEEINRAYETQEAERKAERTQLDRDGEGGLFSFLHENLGRITPKDFDAYGDANLRKGDKSFSIKFLSKKAIPLDINVQELSETYGAEITPQDAIDYIIDRQANPEKYTRSKSKLAALNKAAKIKGATPGEAFDIYSNLDGSEASMKAIDDITGTVLSDEQAIIIKNYLKLKEDGKKTDSRASKSIQQPDDAATESAETTKKEVEPQSLEAISEKYPNITIDVFEDKKNKTLNLGRIIVPEGSRGEGIGTRAMQNLVEYADANNLKFTLTPSKEFGATSVTRLKKFYKQFGFVENKGINRDFSHKESMYRIPELKEEVTEVKEKNVTAAVEPIETAPAEKTQPKIKPTPTATNNRILNSEVSRTSLRSIITSIRMSNPNSSAVDILTDVYKGNVIEEFDYDYLNDEELTYDALTDLLISEGIFDSKLKAINKLSTIGKGIVLRDVETSFLNKTQAASEDKKSTPEELVKLISFKPYPVTLTTDSKTGETKISESSDVDGLKEKAVENVKQLSSSIDKFVKDNTTDQETDKVAKEFGVSKSEAKGIILAEVKENLNGSKSTKSKKPFFRKIIDRIVKLIKKSILIAALVGSIVSGMSFNSSTNSFSVEELVRTSVEILPDNLADSAMRYFKMIGLVNHTDEEVNVKDLTLAPSAPKTEDNSVYEKEMTFTELVSVVPDNHWRNKRNKTDSLALTRNQYLNKNGFTYYTTPVKANYKDSVIKVKDALAVSQFMILDGALGVDLSSKTSKSDLKKYSDKFKRNIKSKEPDNYVPVFTILPGNKVNVKYKLAKDLDSSDIAITRLSQWTFSDLNWDKYKNHPDIKNVKMITTKSGEGVRSLMTVDKNDNLYGRFSGGSVSFIFTDNLGNEIVRDFNGPLKSIKLEGENIIKEFGVDPKKLIVTSYDAGSYTAKPKAIGGILSTEQFSGYNELHPYSGGALIIPKSALNNKGEITLQEVSDKGIPVPDSPMSPNPIEASIILLAAVGGSRKKSSKRNEEINKEIRNIEFKPGGKDLSYEEIKNILKKLKYTEEEIRKSELKTDSFYKKKIKNILDPKNWRFKKEKGSLAPAKRKLPKDVVSLLKRFNAAYPMSAVNKMKRKDLKVLFNNLDSIFKGGVSTEKRLKQAVKEMLKFQELQIANIIAEKRNLKTQIKNVDEAIKALESGQTIIINGVLFDSKKQFDLVYDENSDISGDAIYNPLQPDIKKTSFFKTVNWMLARTFFDTPLMFSKFTSTQETADWIKNNVNSPMSDKFYGVDSDSQILESKKIALSKRAFGSKAIDKFKAPRISQKTGIVLTNSQGISSPDLLVGNVVYLYNAFKQKTGVEKFLNSGYSFNEIKEIVDFVNENKDVKKYADGLVEIYKSYLPDVNKALEDNGYEGIANVDTKTKEELEKQMGKNFADKYYKILESIYGGIYNIPIKESYSPISVLGTDVEMMQKASIFSKEFNISAFAPNSFERKKGGSLNIRHSDLMFEQYVSGMTNMVHSISLLRSFKAMLSDKNIRLIKDQYGSSFASQLQNSVNDVIYGQNKSTRSDQKNYGMFTKWLNRSNAKIMFLNPVSALTQPISFINYAFEDVSSKDYFNNYISYLSGDQRMIDAKKEFLSDPSYIRRFKKNLSSIEITELKNSEFGEFTPWEKSGLLVDQILAKGYILTTTMDSLAIGLGGIPYYAAKRDELFSKYSKTNSKKDAYEMAKKEALKRTYEVTNSSQQSSSQNRLSADQKNAVIRFILSFNGVSMQYSRKIYEAASNIKNKRGNLSDNISNVAYFGLVQAILFQTIKFLLSLIGDDDEEIKKKKKLGKLINRGVDSSLKGFGMFPFALSQVKNILFDLYEYYLAKENQEKSKYEKTYVLNPDKGKLEVTILPENEFMRELSNFLDIEYSKKTYQEPQNIIYNALEQFSPPIGDKIRTAKSAIYDLGEKDLIGVTINLTEFFTSAPVSRIDNVRLSITEDLSRWERLGLITNLIKKYKIDEKIKDKEKYDKEQERLKKLWQKQNPGKKLPEVTIENKN
jgi:GNAT superfamily N-acetyltransferase